MYSTDARVEPRARVVLELGPETHDPIRYQAIAVAADVGKPASARGRAFGEALGGVSAQAALERTRFGASD